MRNKESGMHRHAILARKQSSAEVRFSGITRLLQTLSSDDDAALARMWFSRVRISGTTWLLGMGRRSTTPLWPIMWWLRIIAESRMARYFHME
ncbi:translation initiation factor eIF-2B epsilon subunit [Histoplasma capsulatum]|uniref:Translation initiation factor eIF-2B epsilon subunit n=1 Tax=Ajellomyces capsulatus TaxID=5037 RepID=A0A8A1MFP8_AJECA|nr:translation initiation factor eIF-2B epsilon subunit [Histoplasma capsulatum]